MVPDQSGYARFVNHTGLLLSQKTNENGERVATSRYCTVQFTLDAMASSHKDCTGYELLDARQQGRKRDDLF